jgi:hypothetical protein
MIAVSFGCDDTTVGESEPFVLQPVSMRESEPSLSPDGAFVYYISSDPDDTLNNGIFRADITNPLRQLILQGIGFHSPSLSFDNRTVGFLINGRINLFDQDLDSGWASEVTDWFSSVVFVDSTILIGERGDSLFVIDESVGTVAFLREGYHPTLLSRNLFVFFELIGANQYEMRASNVEGVSVATFFTLSSPTVRPLWPTVHESSSRLAYTQVSGGLSLQAALVNDLTSQAIAIPFRNKAVFARPDQIIFTGSGDKFFQTDFLGTSVLPFEAVKE